MLGVFDSGLGGLTVVREVRRQLPGVRVSYFGDTARMPYGTKSKAVVTQYALEDARFLVGRGVSAIVVACNTASAHAVAALRKEINVPIFEMVAPAVEAALRVTSGKLGVIATAGTVASGVYERRVRRVAPHVRLTSQACQLFVPLVEEGLHSGVAVRDIANTYLRPLGLRGIDTLILGCTHYPFLRRVIAETMGLAVRLVDPAREVVAEVRRAVAADPRLAAALRRGRDRFFVSDVTPRFRAIASAWLREPVRLEKIAPFS